MYIHAYMHMRTCMYIDYIYTYMHTCTDMCKYVHYIELHIGI